MRVLILAAAAVLLAGCDKPAQTDDTPAPSATAPAPAADDGWNGKYEGNLRIEVTGANGAHKVSLLAANPTCTGDIGLEDGGVAAETVSPSQLTLTLHPDAQTTCRIDLRKTGGTVTATEDSCGFYHGAACGFAGTATRVK